MQIKYKPNQGATHRRKRVGCGPGSGHGKTSCRGHKGAGARSGKEYDARFEGGQMPLYRKIPKRGFTNPMRTEYQVVNFSDIERVKLSGTVNIENLKQAGLVSKNLPVKILGKGKISSGLTLQAHAISASALKQLEAAGGKFEKIAKK
ncbi:MAG: 50S ribosomal protein L15 [Candidatus Latescibacteria bacterium]|nr:50S ribosomal protein L15 [Candidatus Latescibacterota bacterium]